MRSPSCKSGNLPHANRAPGCPLGALNAVVLPRPGPMRSAKACRSTKANALTVLLSKNPGLAKLMRPGEVQEQQAPDNQRKSACAPRAWAAHRALSGALPTLAQAQRHCTQVNTLSSCGAVHLLTASMRAPPWAP